jgi:hypothetical protein
MNLIVEGVTVTTLVQGEASRIVGMDKALIDEVLDLVFVVTL